MDNEAEKIFKEQLGKLPNEVTSFLSSAPWSEDLDEIGSLYNLPENELYGFKREATLALVGLVHPDAFSVMLEQEVGIKGAVLEALVANVEKKIFSPIRPALVEFFEKEARNDSVQTQAVAEEAPLAQASPSVVSGSVLNVHRIPDVAPENLPTEEGESLLTSFTPEFEEAEAKETPTHPFEEKMKKVFTAGQQSLGELAIEPSAPPLSATQAPKAPPIYQADPYREPIE
ncbi:MAG: hypothetical protein UW27_C0007G0021 [Parcubacteria group bacterium GW2011_GWA1_44_13]|uniref:Uncharacterized protein n=1 Tax=Candidatus Nomurabacteria bacterium GW2011_GWB1_44_12 TaxID=1618748 RepID=A0A837IIE5_9BACT|nr:MAG: hypothetical protein UW17_C0034G0002 [Candidatus Nomurabacteria bacterium GW2011_GWD1_44_10]KKT36934.1 MAG: hypothetical protein UW25_C0004G0262 [Candidatus Nomurabacteria bacterium GW2011_GWB1_44_12]KKT37966.1 MAG: hypothetical protein UW27_C0007G0021 [Parcubacteria group bacterium GW2011_GWA1_44_13]KKT60830.1 MAG: hypothetical protein UW54_C0003G0008 [Parcubacteria group bacterium GW2011_GWC1_44_26]HBB44110.1 hypothetical protein [Candidatus Yonathbacteria bacterium]